MAHEGDEERTSELLVYGLDAVAFASEKLSCCNKMSSSHSES